MKSSKIYKIKYENDYDDETKVSSLMSAKPDSVTYKTSFGEPLLNPYTGPKDKMIIETYGKDFWGFFNSNIYQTLPMFTYPPEPKSVKRVTADLTISVQANATTYIYVKPFSRYCVVEGDDSTIQKILIPEQMLNCFQKYKVVCAKLMIKQVGIMSLNDGYGTVMDAVMVSPNTSFSYLKENLLSIQAAPGRKLMMVDGRKGLVANFIGSPFYKPIYIDTHLVQPDVIVKDNDNVSVPLYANTTEVGLPAATMRNDTLQQDIAVDGPEFVTNSVHFLTGCAGIQFPQGDAVFIRVSPPSINVSLKVYIDMIVEGQVTEEFQSNMPQIIPPCPFDFNRIFFALNNFVSPLKLGPDDKSFCATKEVFNYPIKPLSFKGRSSSTKLLDKRPGNRARKLFLYKGSLYKDFLHMNTLLNSYYNESLIKNGQNAQEDLSTKPLLPDISYCSENPNNNRIFEYKNEIKIKKISNIINKVELPDYVERACKFTGLLITSLKSTDKNNRLFQDAMKPVPHSSYAFFPAINPNKNIVYPAIVAYTLGIQCKDKITFKVPDPMEENGIKELNIYCDLDEFDKPEEFVDTLNLVVKWVYVKNFHYVPEEGISVKFFGYGKFADKSYMYALLACLYGGPSGGYYTGSFSYKKPSFLPDEMTEEVLNLKIETASPDHPLMFLGKTSDNAVPMNVLSGIVPSYADGRLIPINAVFQATLYCLIPFSIRTIKNTPLFELNADAKIYVSEMSMSWPVKYIGLSNAYSLAAIDNIVKDKMPYSSVVRANPDNYTCYIKKNGRIVNATDYYSKNPELLDVGKRFWHFEYNNRLYVEKNLFNADIRKFPMVGDERAEEKTIAKYDKYNKEILNIGEKDFKNLLNTKEDAIEEVDDLKKSILDIEQMKVNPKATTKDIEKFNPYISQISEVFTAFVKKLRKDRPGIDDRRRIRADKNFFDLCGQLGIEPYVKIKSKIEDIPSYSAIKNMIAKLGNGNTYILATLAGFNKRENNLSKKAVNSALKALEGKMDKLTFPKDDNEDKNIKDEISQMTEKRKNKIKKDAEMSEQMNKIAKRNIKIKDEGKKKSKKKEKEKDSDKDNNSSSESGSEEEEEEDEKEEGESSETDDSQEKPRKTSKKSEKEKKSKKKSKPKPSKVKAEIEPILSDSD